MSGIQLLNSLLQHSSAEGSKSTAMQPLAWAIGLLLTATLFAFYFKTPEWVGQILIGLCIIMVLLYIGAYIYFMLKDPDALRSERYTLKKMEIQKGFQGDNLTGILPETKRYAQKDLLENHTEEGI